MPDAYIHGTTDAREVARLETQADFTAGLTFRRFEARPGQRVLDLATGVGAMAARLTSGFPGIELVGVDLSASQLAAARAHHPSLVLVRSDAASLPFPDGAFDRVHASWLLEHVPSPVPILKEVRRVLAPGGSCQFVEVDNASFGTTPRFPDVDEVWRAMNAAQARGGGDPCVGQRLHHLFRAAGFRRFTVEQVAWQADARDRAFQAAALEEFAEILEGLDESLGATLGALLPRAAAQVRSMATLEGSVLRYAAVLGQGFR